MLKKILLTVLSLGSITAPVTAVVSCSLFGSNSTGKTGLSFYNYQSYISDDIKNSLSEKYDYVEFQDLPDYEVALKRDDTVGGVGSDYFNVILAGKGLIQKIYLKALFPSLSDDRGKWEGELKSIYTPETWKILNSFTIYKRDQNGKIIRDSDENPITDLDGDGVPEKLWEYMIPYFSQNKVVAFNVGTWLDKFHTENKVSDEEYKILKGYDGDAIQALFNTNGQRPTYKQIFNKLKSWGYNKLNVNDYIRDNLMIGSEGLSGDNTTTGEVKDLESGKLQTDSFIKMINNFTTDVIYTTDGTESFQNILDPNNGTSKANVSILYNGDANDGADGSEGFKENTLRAIVPKNSTFLLDGITMSSKINDQDIEVFYKTVYNNITLGYDDDSTLGSFTSPFNKIYSNYNYVGYTPAYSNLYKWTQSVMDENPGKNLTSIQVWLTKATEVASKEKGKTGPVAISSKTLAQPIDSTLLSNITDYYGNKTSK